MEEIWNVLFCTEKGNAMSFFRYIFHMEISHLINIQARCEWYNRGQGGETWNQESSAATCWAPQINWVVYPWCTHRYGVCTLSETGIHHAV